MGVIILKLWHETIRSTLQTHGFYLISTIQFEKTCNVTRTISDSVVLHIVYSHKYLRGLLCL